MAGGTTKIAWARWASLRLSGPRAASRHATMIGSKSLASAAYAENSARLHNRAVGPAHWLAAVKGKPHYRGWRAHLPSRKPSQQHFKDSRPYSVLHAHATLFTFTAPFIYPAASQSTAHFASLVPAYRRAFSRACTRGVSATSLGTATLIKGPPNAYRKLPMEKALKASDMDHFITQLNKHLSRPCHSPLDRLMSGPHGCTLITS